MAQNDHNAASRLHFTTDPEDPDAQLTAPRLSGQGPFQQQRSPMYPNQQMLSSNPSVSPAQNASNVPASRLAPLNMPEPFPMHQFPSSAFADYGRQDYVSYANPFGNPHEVVHSQRPSPSWRPEQQLHPNQGFYAGFMPQGSQGYQSFYPPGPSSYNPHRPGLSNLNPPPHNHNRRRNDHRANVGLLAPNVPAGIGYQEAPLRARTQDARPPRHAPSHAREFGQPPWPFPDGPSRRSDRSTSPRASNRRNFERYSVDLSQSSTSSDAEEAAARAPPLNRTRVRPGPREVRPRYTGRYPHVDANIATASQVQQLKLSLRVHLPSALPKEKDKTCDICSKEYATTQVVPTEEEECAAELACGHIFGEFCIGQWFDTCRTHKNKVSCPMCRTELIEAPGRMQSMMPPTIVHGQAFLDLLREQDPNFAHAYEYQVLRYRPT